MNTTDIAPRLRLRHGSWNALRSVIAGERVPRSELRELWDLNVLDGTALTDPAQELLEGLTGMAGVVHVLGSDAGALRSASVWVAADGVGLLDQIDGDYTILQRVERGIVPPSIVELLNLGPRPQLTEPESQTVPASLVNNVLEPSGDAAEPWTDLADAIEGPGRPSHTPSTPAAGGAGSSKATPWRTGPRRYAIRSASSTRRTACWT